MHSNVTLAVEFQQWISSFYSFKMSLLDIRFKQTKTEKVPISICPFNLFNSSYFLLTFVSHILLCLPTPCLPITLFPNTCCIYITWWKSEPLFYLISNGIHSSTYFCIHQTFITLLLHDKRGLQRENTQLNKITFLTFKKLKVQWYILLQVVVSYTFVRENTMKVMVTHHRLLKLLDIKLITASMCFKMKGLICGRNNISFICVGG